MYQDPLDIRRTTLRRGACVCPHLPLHWRSVACNSFYRKMRKNQMRSSPKSQVAYSENGQLNLFAPTPNGGVRIQPSATPLELALPPHAIRVCARGHIVGHRMQRCDQCGAKVLENCPQCKRSIFLSCAGCSVEISDSGFELSPPQKPPLYCECGYRFPWTRKINTENILRSILTAFEWLSNNPVTQKWLLWLPWILWSLLMGKNIFDVVAVLLEDRK